MTPTTIIEAPETPTPVHGALRKKLVLARARGELLVDVTTEHRRAKMAFIRAALGSGLNWTSIGAALDVTDTAARRFYHRHKGDSR